MIKALGSLLFIIAAYLKIILLLNIYKLIINYNSNNKQVEKVNKGDFKLIRNGVQKIL